jgi:hypothetical protein
MSITANRKVMSSDSSSSSPVAPLFDSTSSSKSSRNSSLIVSANGTSLTVGPKLELVIRWIATSITRAARKMATFCSRSIFWLAAVAATLKCALTSLLSPSAEKQNAGRAPFHTASESRTTATATMSDIMPSGDLGEGEKPTGEMIFTGTLRASERSMFAFKCLHSRRGE